MKYVALLRGINSGRNPSQTMKDLASIFEGMGFTNVHTIIASGNVVFQTRSARYDLLEKKIEGAMLEGADMKSSTIVYSVQEIEELVQADPFKKAPVNGKATVTFLKNPPKKVLSPDGCMVQATIGRAICYSIDMSVTKTPDVMAQFDKAYGKEVTTRTWATVLKIAKVLNNE